MATLLTLPLELLIAVSAFLPTPDLNALRLTCKQTEKSLYEWFSQEFFTKKQFMLTDKSLQALIDISKHVSFSKKLTHVIIATNQFDWHQPVFRDAEAAQCWDRASRDQKALISTGHDCEMLAEAFQNLENLQTVGIRDFNNDRRYRDGIGASWTSWGSTTVFNETGQQLSFSRDADGFVPHLFQVLVRALGKANRHPGEIEVLLRHGFLNDSAFYLPNFSLPMVKPVLQNLKKLLLAPNVGAAALYNLVQAPGAIPGQNGIQTPGAIHGQNGLSLRRFLGHTPNLTHLRLNLQAYHYAENKSFLEWLAKTESDGQGQTATWLDPAPVELLCLTSLELGQFRAEPATIFNVISKFEHTLEDLSLWRLTLVDPDAAIRGHGKLNRWVGLFTNLAKLPELQLRSLKVGLLKQDHLKTSFQAGGRDDAPLEAIREYSGPKMDAFLQDLIDETVVQWPNDSIAVHTDDEGDDEDEDDEDGMDVDEDEDEVDEDDADDVDG